LPPRSPNKSNSGQHEAQVSRHSGSVAVDVLPETPSKQFHETLATRAPRSMHCCFSLRAPSQPQHAVKLRERDLEGLAVALHHCLHLSLHAPQRFVQLSATTYHSEPPFTANPHANLQCRPAREPRRSSLVQSLQLVAQRRVDAMPHMQAAPQPHNRSAQCECTHRLSTAGKGRTLATASPLTGRPNCRPPNPRLPDSGLPRHSIATAAATTTCVGLMLSTSMPNSGRPAHTQRNLNQHLQLSNCHPFYNVHFSDNTEPGYRKQHKVHILGSKTCRC